MTRREMLKMGLIVAAIPVGANMVWKRSSFYRRSQIVKRTHLLLDNYMDEPAVKEAMAFVDDVLDLTFSIRQEGEGELAEGPELDAALGAVHYIERQLSEPLTARETGTLCGVHALISVNYSHQVSEDALEVLRSVGLVAKVYQMRPKMRL